MRRTRRLHGAPLRVPAPRPVAFKKILLENNVADAGPTRALALALLGAAAASRSYSWQNVFRPSWSAATLEKPKAEAAASIPPNCLASAETLLP